ncbi:heavy metal-associated domain protein [Anaerofustis stercorihominis DSM 17244]|uniref:Heavy metal-associated domain protein n=1 Tax=Anaerofustis stercorihominis DSM 17244 TaxID=445971 RepID=B1C9F8_9FIRM|nr:cation transporter [Anaerofustis stercorihominis]EDS72529.1 heavy metal-associated domain protein [Anaerofustis stercorihominis DSM 17244]
MKKKLKMDNIDCAHCAMEMEEEIRKIDGVNSANINFMLQKLTLDADDEKFDEILEQARKAVKGVDKDAVIL